MEEFADRSLAARVAQPLSMPDFDPVVTVFFVFRTPTKCAKGGELESIQVLLGLTI